MIKKLNSVSWWILIHEFPELDLSQISSDWVLSKYSPNIKLFYINYKYGVLTNYSHIISHSKRHSIQLLKCILIFV